MFALDVAPPGGVEDLKDAVRVEREVQAAQAVEVFVDPAQRALRVFHRAGHEEAGAGHAEAHLTVDTEGGDAEAILPRGLDAVAQAIVEGGLGDLRRALDVDLADARGFVEGRER